ncbi:MAG: hypothetical protein D6816_02690 [Bacteroidetes bacterium]|nr:MAG: hypothetical protein D6816_02690 [Bacteroidota bacterium]
MDRQINAALFGVGNMGKLTAAYMLEKGVNIVSAFNRTSHVGEDLGIASGLGHLNVTIESIDGATLDQDLDVAVITAVSDMKALFPLAERCLLKGINVITISEEAFFPAPSEPELTDRLDCAAKANNATLVSTGVQDIFWLSIPANLTGACHVANSIVGTSKVNLDVYGPAVVSQFPIGLTPDQFNSAARNDDAPQPLPIFGIALEALVAKLGFTVIKRTLRYEPLFDSVAIRSDSLDRLIDPGLTTGLSEISEITTKEGIDCRVEFIQKIFGAGESEEISWRVGGIPDLQVKFDNFMGAEITCATLVNRIPDVINAEPGFSTVSDLPIAVYRSSPLHKYINRP